MSIGAVRAATIAAGSQRGAPPNKLGGKAAYKPPTASIATNGGQSGSRGLLCPRSMISHKEAQKAQKI